MYPTWRRVRKQLGDRRPKSRKIGDVRASVILVLVSLASLTFITMPLVFLFCLMQTTTRANPEVNAYNLTLGTHMEPIFHGVQSHGHPREFSSATNFAREYLRPELAEGARGQEIQVSTKRERRLVGHKQARVGHRRKHEQHEQSAQAYAEERNYYWQPRYQ
jgi:hypothetical protein